MSTNKSLEPLFNEGDVNAEGGKVTAIAEIGAASHRTPVNITSGVHQFIIGAGKGSIEFENAGSKVIYYGGSGVSSANGIAFYPRSKIRFLKVKGSFNIFLVTAGADVSEIRIVEYI